MSSDLHDRVIPLPTSLEGAVASSAAGELADELVELLEVADNQTRFAVASMLAACRLPGVTGTLLLSVVGDCGELRASFTAP